MDDQRAAPGGNARHAIMPIAWGRIRYLPVLNDRCPALYGGGHPLLGKVLQYLFQLTGLERLGHVKKDVLLSYDTLQFARIIAGHGDDVNVRQVLPY